MDNYVGKRLDGRYEVQEIIGVGGMSVVYKAYDNVDDRIVAVKILKDEFLQNDDFVRRFKNESKAIAVMSHPNIVKVYDVSFGEKLQYIVMEYVDGITLKEYIQKQGAITWNDALYFTTQILRALQHAHDKGQRGHEDGAQAQAAGFDGGLHGGAASKFQLASELHDQDGVLGRQPHQHDEPDLCEHIVVAAAQPHAGHGSQQAHGHDEDDGNRQGQALVLRRQHQKDQQDGDGEHQHG